MLTSDIINVICSQLERVVGNDRLGNLSDPLEEALYIILSQKTKEYAYQHTYHRLIRHYGQLSNLATAPTEEIAEFISDAGLAILKARRIKDLLNAVKTRFGVYSLDALFSLTTEEAEKELLALPGIGLKSAKCILLYSLNRPVLPIDTHTHRLAFRIGLIPCGLTTIKAHRIIEEIIPPQHRYAFHVGAIKIGRSTCQRHSPNCPSCLLEDLCEKQGVATGINEFGTTRVREAKRNRRPSSVSTRP